MAPPAIPQPGVKASTPAYPPPIKRSGKGKPVVVFVLVGLGAVLLVGLLAAIVIPAFMRSGNPSKSLLCINNLRQIEGANELYGLENGHIDGMVLTWDNLNPYIMDMSNKVCCQSAPVEQRGLQNYSLEPVGTDPKCLVVGDAGGHSRTYQGR